VQSIGNTGNTEADQEEGSTAPAREETP
jgi:hypothetical protein